MLLQYGIVPGADTLQDLSNYGCPSGDISGLCFSIQSDIAFQNVNTETGVERKAESDRPNLGDAKIDTHGKNASIVSWRFAT